MPKPINSKILISQFSNQVNNSVLPFDEWGGLGSVAFTVFPDFDSAVHL